MASFCSEIACTTVKYWGFAMLISDHIKRSLQQNWCLKLVCSAKPLKLFDFIITTASMSFIFYSTIKHFMNNEKQK